MQFHGSQSVSFLLIAFIWFMLAFAQLSEHEADDYAESGNYHILYCHANTTNSQAAFLQAFLPYVWSNLQAVFADLELGVDSPHGYNAFFKTNSSLDAVRRVFKDMVDGPEILTSAGGSLGEKARWTAPTFVCVNEGEPDTVMQQGYCKDPKRPVMTVSRHTGIIAICPIFWNLPRIARRPACPRVANNEFTENGWTLATTQYAVAVHELVHLYNVQDNMRAEVYDIWGAVNLTATKSFENAQNFAYYAACKYGYGFVDA